MRCPDHSKELVNGQCPMCQGALMTEDQLGEGFALLSFDPAPIGKPRSCPQCEAKMRSLRIGKTQAWVEHCPACAHYWVEKSDTRTLDMVLKSQARQKAFATFSDQEKKELAQGLAEATHQDTGPDLGIAGAALVAAGVPVVDRVQGDQTPWLTWAWALALCGVYLAVKPEDLAYRAGSGDLVAAVTSGFAHFGIAHLVGNVLFLFVFGAAAERKLPRWAFAASMVVLAPLTTLCEALATADGTAIGGASGAIAGLIGACLFLQPRARVTLSLTGVPIPLWLYGVGWAAVQAVLFVTGVPGVAWLAHLSGFALGLALGFVFSRAKQAP